MGTKEQVEFQDTQENLENQVECKLYHVCSVAPSFLPVCTQSYQEVREKYKLLFFF